MAMKLSCSHNSHGFQALLERLPKSKRVTIVTYSLDEDAQSPLLDGLRKLREDCHLTIITSIPKRFEGYFGNNPREQAKKVIEAYLENLMPGNFSCTSEVYFSFQNHAKIVVVDDVAYVGSANFTKASASNFEAGVIISGKDELEELGRFVEVIRKGSLPLLKAGNVKAGRTVFKLTLLTTEIVRSVREENGFILCDDGHWIEDEDLKPKESVQISEKLLRFLGECRTAAEELLKLCGGAKQVLNDGILKEVIEFVRYFEEGDYHDSLPKPFDEAGESNRLVEKLLNQCSNDGNVDDVMGHPEYNEQLEAARSASEHELDAAVAEAVNDLVEHIEITTSKLRSSFGQEDVSPRIDNTGGKYGR
ncbi:hypothetical protein GC207_14900 [bacterium]|nr:hypothetical protein [bacterium]